MQKSASISINPNSVIMEGLRRLDEWGMISTKIKTNHEIFTPTDDEKPDESTAEGEVYAFLDGETTVEEAAKQFSGTRFECCKAIYNLLDEEFVRPLTLEELRGRASIAEAENDFAKATVFWRYAAELCPDDPQFYLRLGETCKKFFQEDEADQAFLSALRLYTDQADWDNAASVAEKLPTNMSLSRKDLHVILQTFIELKNVKRALWAGNLLAEAFQEEGETDKAVEVLDSLVRLDPTDLNLRINVATLVQKTGNTERAIKYYEEVETALEQQKKVKDQIKILRIICDLDGTRADVKQKIAMLTVLQEKLERRRKRRITIAGVGLILAVVCTVIPMLYELKARELFAHADRMEEISLNSGDFSRTREAYEKLINDYGWSLKTEEAKIALDRINQVERNFLDTADRAKKKREQERIEAKRRKEQQFADYLSGGRAAEKAGDYEKAHKLLSSAMAIGEPFLQSREILLPVHIVSSPSGAQVTLGDGGEVGEEEIKTLGKTPLVFHYKPETEAVFGVSLRGCEGQTKSVTLTTQHELVFNLARTPSWEYVLQSNFRQAFHEAENLLIIPSRDGNIYAFDPKKRDVIWQRKVGRFGDRISDLHIRGSKIYLSTVVGETASMDAATGTPHWVRPVVRGPVMAAPVTSENGRFVATVSLLGEVAVLAESSGQVVGSFATENEITSSPIFAGDFLIVGSTDSFLYVHSISARKLVHTQELTAAVVVDPIRFGEHVVMPTADGRLHFFSTKARKILWSPRIAKTRIHSLLSVNGKLLVASTAGQLTPVDPSTKTVSKPFSLGRRPLSGVQAKMGKLYATHTDGLLSVWNLETRKHKWSWQAESPISVPPVVTGDRIFVACHSGAVEVLEILE